MWRYPSMPLRTPKFSSIKSNETLLKTGITKMICFADVGPVRDWLRSSPSQIAYRRSGEWDALIGGHALRIGDARNGGRLLCEQHSGSAP
jgi:hypothetical protein